MNRLARLVPPLSAMIRSWTGNYQTRGRDQDADCVIGFSFGYRGPRGDTEPGLSNQDLADVAMKHYASLPKILQFEIADAYMATGGKDPHKIIRIAHHRIPGHYLDTLEVAIQAQMMMEQHGWQTALLLADPYHMPRVQAVCTQLGINWVADRDEEGAVEFDPQSNQGWTRSLAAWHSYEPLALMYYRLRGWI